MVATPARTHKPTVALLPWGNVLEDFLETAEISLDEFLGDFVGSWMFGYVEAMQRADVRTVLVCVSRDVHTRPVLDLRLLVVGTGHHRDELDRLLSGSDLRGIHRVDQFVHDRAELRDLLVAADAYAFPSRLEGFAVALAEAMACGLPPVAADASGVREILGGDLAGTIEPRDDAESLANGLLELLDDPQAARERGAAARRRVEAAFALDRVGAQLRELFFPAVS